MRSVSKSITTQLTDRLITNRNAITASNIGYRMLGKNMVLPDTCIDMLCKKAKFKNSDISTVLDYVISLLTEEGVIVIQ